MSERVAVRVMEAADLEPARWIVYRAYLEVLIALYGPESGAQYEVRAMRFMRMYLDREPQGCLVAELPDGMLAGVAFCFAWGAVGWFGSLAVAPEHQGRGIGQALTRRCISYLHHRGCRRIGLETWPEMALVRHLYGKLGFLPQRPTVKLSRQSRRQALASGWRAEWLGGSRLDGLGAALDAVQRVTRRLHAGGAEPPADYRQEVLVPLEAGWGHLLLVHGLSGEPEAFMLCYEKKPSGGASTALDVRLLLVAPGPADETALDVTLALCDQRALDHSMGSVSCDVNLRHARAAALLRARGFRPVYELQRMELPLEGFDALARSPALEMVRWAG
jgi:GNAT superfamily N-acetyltransferase